MFWKLVFPSYAYQYRNIEKWIHGLAIVPGEQTHTWSKDTCTLAFKIVCLVGQLRLKLDNLAHALSSFKKLNI